MTSHAIILKTTGGSENMIWQEVEVPEPEAGQVTIRHTYVGLNFIDIYHRSGLYPVPHLPSGLGYEAAGVVEKVGDGVTHLRAGDNICYLHNSLGSYCEKRTIDASRVVQIPDAITLETGAAMLLKGLTSWYLLHRTYPVQKGTRILVHAAAGGVGTFMMQWANSLGAHVIGVVSSESKAKIACEQGAHEVIICPRDGGYESLASEVKLRTRNEGVDVVYDSVGKSTYIASLNCLKPMGMMVSYGNASGPLPPLDARDLTSRGSLYFTRPGLFDYIARDSDYQEGVQALVTKVLDKTLTIPIGQRFALRDVAEAHRALESGVTTGPTVLVV